ncbi:MAG: carbamoyltransferase HypF [Promethearchaeota archaeon]
MTEKTVEINITGIVQGVGFRPFLFNLAKDYNLNGVILNRGNAGVRLIVQGEPVKIQTFIDTIPLSKPVIAYIESINSKEIQTNNKYDNLEIIKSEQGRGISLTLPPDIATCIDCVKDMRDKDLEKYFNYPFIACAVCGPRFTTVRTLPYDRERTTMSNFPLCKHAFPQSCIKEYNSFNNRRFHAQTFACSVCGPNYTLYDKSKKAIPINSIEEMLLETAKKINNGEIGAIKGIGGVHLVCLAEDSDVISKLRNRKGDRKFKPFAVMIPNLGLIEKEFKISEKEKELLESFRRPIVLLERKNLFTNPGISEEVAPGLNNVGIMLPYSGIHYLLFDYIGEKPLVYTSGNKSNIPMGIDNNIIFDQLHDLADFFLLHNRPIFQRADDSVLRIHNDKSKLIRRSRGYVPEYLSLPFKVEIQGAIATGPELTTTGAILRRNRIFPTQHIGNTTNLETYEFLKDAIFHMKNLLQIKDSEIEFVCCDAHPAFVSTKLGNDLASSFKVRLYPIQHHFAHVLGLMAENKVEKSERVVGISVDGVGYGDDGNVWGGEILLSSYHNYKRLAHLQYQPMIGADRCTKYPARMVASILLNKLGIEEATKLFTLLNLKKDLEYKEKEIKTIISQYNAANNHFPAQNIPLTSSAGRIFDCISYILGASKIKTYRGEPAMRLEGLAAKGNPKDVNLEINYTKNDGVYVIESSDLILQILKLKLNNSHLESDIAAAFQIKFAEKFAELAIKIATDHNIDKIGLTGGVAYNYSFSNTIKNFIEENGFTFLEHDVIASGDAGISTGQLIGGLFKSLKKN